MKRPARSFHRRFWMIASLALPIIFLSLMVMKQTPPADQPPVLLEAPE